MLCFVSYIRSEITTNDAMPSGIVFLVELFLDVSRNILVCHIVMEKCFYQLRIFEDENELKLHNDHHRYLLDVVLF